ncbi:GspE/PulE family protein [Hyphomonas sp.]|uniref:GspE/PulE family protein n=1 Tax=Hyphomonas sp. TaxID=87 RepID=UPI00391CE33C
MSRSQVTYAFARDKGVAVIPGRAALTFAVREGADPLAVLEAARVTGIPAELEAMTSGKFERQLSESFGQSGIDGRAAEAAAGRADDLETLFDGLPQTEDLLAGDGDAPIITLINGLLQDAIRRRASDIHIDPFEDKLTVRYRIDGELQEVLSASRRVAAPLVSRIKVMSRLDIAEKRMPQDGRISLSLGGRALDVRVATLPTRYGERVALRLLDTRQALLGLESLGMDTDTLGRFRSALSEPNGVILVTGPTGSGKTTTLYSALAVLNTGRVNIMTLEDPVEYGLDGISQTPMDHKVGLTFAATLRSILRNDPNIVMVGEIRDVETAEVALEFALTGRLALSTIHTNSSAGAITRLRDMGVESFLLASTLRAILAQRLLRQLCPHCKEAYTPTPALLERLGLAPDSAPLLYQAKGCPSCNHTGYDGRLGVYELLVVDGGIRRMIHEGATEEEIERVAFARYDMLFQNGLRHVLSGESSAEELLYVCRREAWFGGSV